MRLRKKQDKKLTLRKETIARLELVTLDKIYGGQQSGSILDTYIKPACCQGNPG